MLLVLAEAEKKYKHCCANLAQNEIIFKERIDILLNLFTWISNNYPKYIEECAKLFFNVQDIGRLSNIYEKYGMNSLICFNEFMLSDNIVYESNEYNFLDKILHDNTIPFTDNCCLYIESLRRSHLSMYEVQYVDQFKFIAKDLLCNDRKEVTIWRPEGLDLYRWEIVALRDLQLPEIDAGCCGGYRFDREVAVDLCKKITKEIKRNTKLKNPENIDFLIDGVIINNWFESVANAQQVEYSEDVSDEKFTLTIDTYDVSDSKYLSQLISKMRWLRSLKTESSSFSISKKWVLLHEKENNNYAAPFFTRIFTHFSLENNTLMLSSFSKNCADNARKILKDIPTDLLTFRTRSTEMGFQNPALVKSHISSTAKKTGTEDLLSELLNARRSVYTSMLDHPLAALDGKTPRHAATLKTYRQRVIDLVKRIEVDEQKMIDLSSSFDCSMFWDNLGLR